MMPIVVKVVIGEVRDVTLVLRQRMAFIAAATRV